MLDGSKHYGEQWSGKWWVNDGERPEISDMLLMKVHVKEDI